MTDILNSGLGSPEKLKTSSFGGGNEIARFASAASLEKARKLDEEIAAHNQAVDEFIRLKTQAESGRFSPEQDAVEVAAQLDRLKRSLPQQAVKLIEAKQKLFETLFFEYQVWNKARVAELREAEAEAEKKAVAVLPDPKHAWTRREIVACLVEKEREAALWRPLLFEGTGVALELELNEARTLLARAMTGR